MCSKISCVRPSHDLCAQLRGNIARDVIFHWGLDFWGFHLFWTYFYVVLGIYKYTVDTCIHTCIHICIVCASNNDW